MSFMWLQRFSSDMDIVLDTSVRESIQITLIRHELPTKHNAYIAEGFVLSDILNIFVSHPIDYNAHLCIRTFPQEPSIEQEMLVPPDHLFSLPFVWEFVLSNSFPCCFVSSLYLFCLFILIVPLQEYPLATLCSSQYCTHLNRRTVMEDNSLYAQDNSNLLYIMQC